MLFCVEWRLLNEAIVERLLLIVLELYIVFFGLVAKDKRLSLQVKHVFVLFSLFESGGFGLQLAFIRCFPERSKKLSLIYIFFHSL